jgi:hypothetical protein
MAIAGITTNHCCETTARITGNLGYRVRFVLDATLTFDRRTPDGELVTADELCHVTANNLHGEFATVVPTRQYDRPATSQCLTGSSGRAEGPFTPSGLAGP